MMSIVPAHSIDEESVSLNKMRICLLNNPQLWKDRHIRFKPHALVLGADRQATGEGIDIASRGMARLSIVPTI